MRNWKYFAAIVTRLNLLDRWSLTLQIYIRLWRADVRSIFRKIPRRYYLAPLHMLIFFIYTALIGVDASQPWPVLLSVYGASLSTAISVWVLARC